MRAIIAFESSGIVREAFRTRGVDAWSCDLLPAEDGSPFHHQCDAREILSLDWDFAGMHPPCTYVSGSGIHWNNRGRGWERTEEALALVRWLLDRPMPHYLENPVGIISTRIRKPDQTIQPYEFGDDASKRTCLWLHDLPKLIKDPSQFVKPRLVNGKPRWANQTDGGQNKLGPSEGRAQERARTYPGIAKAMAERWSNLKAA